MSVLGIVSRLLSCPKIHTAMEGNDDYQPTMLRYLGGRDSEILFTLT